MRILAKPPCQRAVQSVLPGIPPGLLSRDWSCLEQIDSSWADSARCVADHNWLHLLDEASPNGAIPCTVPGPAGTKALAADLSCDASWASVFPTVAWSLLKYLLRRISLFSRLSNDLVSEFGLL